MKSTGLAILLLSIITISCNKNCEDFAPLFTVRLQDSANQIIQLDSSFTQRLANGQLVRARGYDSAYFASGNTGYTILNDQELNSGEIVQFVGIVDTAVVIRENYTFNWDGCHLERTSGRTSIVLP